MSTNFNPNGYLSNAAFSHGDNPYFQDDTFDAFDGPFAGQGGNNPTQEQHWDFTPEQFDLAQPDQQQNNPNHQHAWSNNNVDPRNVFASHGASHNQFENSSLSSVPANINAYNGAPYGTSADFDRSSSRQIFSNGIPAASSMADSPYSFQGSGVSHFSTAPGTISPQALQSNVSPVSKPRTAEASRESTQPARSGPSNDHHLFMSIPGGRPSGNFLVTTVEDLENVTKSRRLAPYLHVATLSQDAPITRSTLPVFVRRKSRNEIIKLLASDSNLKAKVDKKLSKRLAKQASKPAASLVKSDVARRHASEPLTDDSSSDDESPDESEEESMQAPIPPKRPTDSAIEAVKYDTIKTLWRVPYRSAPAEEIRQAIQGFWEIIQTIRDRWKSDLAAVKQAEETNKVNDLPTLKERVGSQRGLLQASLKAAVAHGHTDILENFGQHLQLMGAMAVFLQDRIKESDYNGTLMKAILEFLSRCKSMTKGIVERSQMGKLLSRVVKRGDETMKALIRKINENASSASEKRREESTDPSAALKSKNAKVAPTIERSASPSSGAKRAREADGDIKPPIKKLATTKPVDKATNVLTTKVVPAKRPASADVKPNTPATSQPTTKKVVAKPSSLFASLQSAKIKPSVAKASRAGETKPSIVSDGAARKPPTTSAASGPSAFSFAATMADLTKPKELEQEVKREESAPLETSEERIRRLRKEKRRRLRVSFKADNELVDIRYFTHDPDEDVGHDASQVRDVGDLGSEGRMFKQLQHQRDEDAMEIDDDEEGEDDVREPESEYLAPSEIDFSEVPEDERQRNYDPYGGGMQAVESAERVAQERREADTLMVIYSHRAEIPPSPREPPEVQEEPPTTKYFGEPGDETKTKLASLTKAQPVPSPMPDLSALLGSITGQQQFQPHQPQNVTATSLEDIFARFSHPGMQQPSHNQLPQQYSNMQNPSPQQQQYPYLQQTQSGQQPQQQQTAPMFGQLPPQQTQQQLGGATDIAALLATLQSNGSIPTFTPLPQTQQAAPPMPTMPGLPQMQAQIPNMGFNPYGAPQPPPPPPPPPAHENEERRQMRVAEAFVPPAQGERPKPKFVVQCKYFKEGKCLKGANCTFRHDPD